MDSWLTFWKALLIGAFSLFGILAIAVTIGGFFDIRAIFRAADEQRRDDTSA